MSVYSGEAIKTKLLEPSTYNENISAEFRITEACLPNLRLIDVGSKNSQDVQYNKLIGAYGVLRSVLLYSGQMLLDGCPNNAQFVAFKKYNHSNATNRNLKRFLARNQLGFKSNKLGVMTDEPTTNNQSGITDAKTTLAYIPVSEYCPLLNNLNVLDPKVYANLRLVLEFEGDRNAFLNVSNSTSHNGRRPRLIMDCLESGNYQPNPAVVSWNAIEQDRFTCPKLDVGAVTIQPNTNKLNGFNSKLVGRMLLCKNFQDESKNAVANAITGFGRYASHAQQSEAIQITVNGAQQLPRNGVEGAGNRMLSMLHDTWGECDTMPMGNTLGLTDVATAVTQLQKYQGQQSYFGMFVNQRVKDLQINLTRTGLIDNTGGVVPTNEALLCSVFCEVSKSLVTKGGVTNTVYN